MEDKLYDNYSGALSSIRSSGGWMKFLAILMYVGAFFMLLIAVFAIIGSSFMLNALEKSPALAALSFAPAVIGIVFLIIAFVIGLLAYWMHTSGSGASKIGPMQVEAGIIQYASNFRKYLVFSFVISILGLLGSIIALIAIF